MSQTDRFHRALHNAGPRGITRLDFEHQPVIDGGPPILRVARCAGDLKARGIHVVSDPHGGPGRCAIYWLAEHAPAGAIRNDGRPDVPETPAASGFVRVVVCHGCLTTHQHPFVCPHGRRTEVMLARPDHLIDECERQVHQQEVRRAA